MKKIFMENEVLKSLVERASLFSSEANAQVSFIFGVNINASANACLNTMSIIAGTEQYNCTFVSLVPKNYEAQYNEVVVGEQTHKILVPYWEETFKVSDFLSTVGALVGLGEMLFLKKTDSGLIKVGAKDNSVELQLESLAAEQKAMPVIADKDKCMTNVKFSVPDFINALRIGGCMVHKDSEEARGMGNIILSMQYESKENTSSKGLLKIYSTNGFCLSRGECSATFVEDTSIHNNLAQYLTANKAPNYFLGIPKKSQVKLLKLLKDVQECNIIATDKHVCALIGQDAVFTFVLSANVTAAAFKADELQKQEKAGFKIVCDNETLKGKVDILNNVFKNKNKQPGVPLLLSITNKNVVMEITGKKDMGTVKVDLVSSNLPEGKKVYVYMDGEKLATTIASMKKGNITLSCAQDATYIAYLVQVNTGDDDTTSKEVVLLAPMQKPKEEKETAALEEA